MKTFKLIVCLFLVFLNSACDEDVQNYDFEKYKFVSFIDEEVSLPETYSIDNVLGYPLYLQYDGSVLDEDFTVNLKFTESFAQKDVDYSIASTVVTFKAGEIRSEPFYIATIDDLLNSAEDRSLEIEIESVSNSNISIGVGVVNQSNKTFLLNLLDNECSETTSIFNSSAINNSAGGATVNGSVSGDIVTLVGNLISYGAFSNAELGITLTPEVAGATIGTVTFDAYDAGTDNDGYVYQFRQNGGGTYDVCAGEIKIKIDVYYISGGAWVFWKTTNNTFKIE